jgi:EKC/KEOPS complex subunit CGI121/TPRKB
MSDIVPFKEFVIPVFTKYKCFAVLVNNVENLQTIKENLIKGNTDYDYAFINAKNITSLEQLYSVYYKVMLDERNGTMKSRTLHTEIIYALSPFKNIMDCLNKYGISKTADSLLVIKIMNAEDASAENVQYQLANIKAIVHGDFIELSDINLQKSVDMKLLEKNYKLKIFGTPLENNWASITRNLVSITQLKGL